MSVAGSVSFTPSMPVALSQVGKWEGREDVASFVALTVAAVQ